MILIFGFGLWFWSIILIEAILLFWFVEQEWPEISVVSVGLCLVLLWWLADIPVWKWIHDNPGKLAKYVGYYILVGIAWTFIKYYFKLKDMQGRIKSLKKSWVLWRQDASDKDPSIVTFEDYVNRKAHAGDITFNASARKLTLWAAFWPPSMIWTLINDPIKKFFNWLIHDILIGAYKKMYDTMIGKMLKDG